MSRHSVPRVFLELPDYDLGLRVKSTRADKLGPGGRASMCTILFGLSVVDEVVDTPLSNAANGYPDATAVPDESTRRELFWRPRSEAVIADLVDGAGEPIQESPRSLCQRLVGEYAALDLVPTFGFEYEFYLHHAEPGEQPHRPVGRTIGAYSHARLAAVDSLAEEFMGRMESVGAPIEAFHSELGPGFLEFAMSPAPALAAADGAARARAYMRELCEERGLHATFMAKVHAGHSGSGGHVHSSLARAGANVFGAEDGRLSPTGSAYLGGLLSTMGDFSVLFNPFINSYKRISPDMFVAARASWGFDNRNAACRVITNMGSSSARVEHRRPGADASPYLVAAGILAGGLHGLRNGADPGPGLQPGAEVGGDPLPADLHAAVDRFEASDLTSDLLGDRFVASFAATRRGELDAYDAWWRNTVTDWERDRYLENL
ncbi:glutamine synthetase family protein [Nocardioides bigeumensis]|uniref:Glutamine synthetase family protein n=1 Tax=Nocardioides bigeumensis TaxID=433657 RepID=A0ABN2YEX4_9ACTN